MAEQQFKLLHNAREGDERHEVELELNNTCQIACTHCFLGLNGKVRELQEAVTITSELMRQGFRVIPFAGEMTMTPNLMGIYQMIGQKYMLTNGLLLAGTSGSEIAQKIKASGIEQVGLTLHENGAMNTLRGIPLAVTRKAVDTIKQAGMIPTVTSVITTDNYLRVDQLCQTAIDMGARAIRFSRLIPTNPARLRETISTEQTKVFFEQFRKARQTYSLDTLGIYTNGLFGPGRSDKVNPDEPYCPAGRKLFTVAMDNTIYPCLLLTRPEDRIGYFDPRGGNLMIDDSSPFYKSQYYHHECSAYALHYLTKGGK